VKIVRHLITGDPILVAPERAARPHAFGPDGKTEVCPFCAGNEALTPPEVARVEREGAWLARAFPNKYPAAEAHEVIVESPEHGATFDRIVDATAVVDLYVDRYLSLAAHSETVCLFKNHGPTAGASLEHLHSQIVGVPFTPPRIAREAAAFAAADVCPLCVALETHRAAGLILEENETFAWLAPSSSRMANEQWLVPKRHQHEMATLRDVEIADLAALLQACASAMHELAPSYNWLFMNFPRAAASHFYVEAFPRRTTIAGFELATGTLIEVIEPAETVRVIRKP
jgi:UDPglucose--hexose-1-phosphate uridylyltransferase